MTTPEQDKIIAALAAEHGAVKVLLLRCTTAVLACGWSEAADTADGGRAKWWYVPPDPAAPAAGVPRLRYAHDYEVSNAEREDAFTGEQAAVRELLSAAGLRP